MGGTLAARAENRGNLPPAGAAEPRRTFGTPSVGLGRRRWSVIARRVGPEALVPVPDMAPVARRRSDPLSPEKGPTPIISYCRLHYCMYRGSI